MSTTAEVSPEEVTTEETTTEEHVVTETQEESKPSDEKIRLDHLTHIEELNAGVLRALSEWDSAKSTAAELKKVYENRNSRLLTEISDRGEQRQLPFNETQKLAGTDWERLPLTAAGIDGKRAEKMIEAGVDTLGKIAAANLTDIKGFGPEAQGWVADQMIKFWSDHPEFCQDGVDDKSNADLPSRIMLLCDLPSASDENMLYMGTEFNVVGGIDDGVIVKGMDDDECAVSAAEYVAIKTD